MKVVYPPTIDWTLLHQRPQFILKALAKAGHECYFYNANPPYAGAQHVSEPTEVEENITLLPPHYSPKNLGEFVLYYSYPPHHYWLEHHKPVANVFDLLDWPLDESILPDQKRAVEDADMVLTVSDCLTDYALKVGKYAPTYILNGIDYAFLRKNTKHELPEPIRSLKEQGKTIIGYTGVIGEGYTDWGLFVKIAERYPDAAFVLTGTFYTEYGTLPDNMYFLGHVDREMLPTIISSFDVGVIPFANSRFARAMCPLKFFDYLACGIPIVSTPIPEVEKAGFAYIGRDHDHFLERIPIAIAENTPGYSELRIQEAERYDWDNILNPFVKKFDDLVATL